MRLWHAAALALVGWYLMVPPQSTGWFSGKKQYDDAAPLNEWTIEQSFDSARICEAIRSAPGNAIYEATGRWIESLSKCVGPKADVNRLAHCPADSADEDAATDPDLTAKAARMAAARCIASNDPRLREGN